MGILRKSSTTGTAAKAGARENRRGVKEATEALDFLILVYESLTGDGKRPQTVLETGLRLAELSEDMQAAVEGLGEAALELGELTWREFDELFGARLGRLGWLAVQDLAPAPGDGGKRGTKETEEILDAALGIYEELEQDPLRGSVIGVLLRARKHLGPLRRAVDGWQDALPELADLTEAEWNRVYRDRAVRLAYFVYRDTVGSFLEVVADTEGEHPGLEPDGDAGAAAPSVVATVIPGGALDWGTSPKS